MARKKKIKGDKVELGIWHHISGEGYVAEINYTDPQIGRRVREQKTTHRLDLAREWRKGRAVDAERGEIKRKKDQPKPLRFSDFGEEYLESWSKVKKKPSTYLRDEWSIKRLGKTFGRMHLSEITRRDVERYVAERKAEGMKPTTINRELCCLKNMLRKAVDWQYLESNPAWGVKQQKEGIPEIEFLTDEEIVRLLDNCAEHLKALFILAIHTGMRRGELFKLEWRDVNFSKGENGMIAVRDTKNHDTRHIPMNALVRSSLQKHPKRLVDGKVCSLVFTREDGQPFKRVKEGLEGALERAGIERRVRFHDLRHTFASHLVMRGVDMRTVAQLLGHKDIKVTMRYAHLAPDHLQSAVETLEKPLERRTKQQAAGGTA